MGYDIPSDHHSSPPRKRTPGRLSKEVVNSKYENLLDGPNAERRMLDNLILATPTSEERELLSGVNILLTTAIRDIQSAQKLLK